MVTSVELERLRNMSFGWKFISNPVDRNVLLSEIQKYDVQDAALVSERIRKSAGLSTAATSLLNIYQTAIEEFSGTSRRNPQQELRECAGFFQDIAPFCNTFFLAEQQRRNELLAELLATVQIAEGERNKIRIADASGPKSLDLEEFSNITVRLENLSSCCLSSYPPYPVNASYHW